MKWVFLGAIAFLTLASIADYFSRERESSGAPIVYLVSSPGKEAQERAAEFRRWLKTNGRPDVDLRIDAANVKMSKIVMQGVSGIASDLIQSNGNADLSYYQSLGILRDLDPLAQAGNYLPERFEPAIRNEMVVDGRQYGCPVSLYLLITYINRKTFEDLGLSVPPPRMTWEEFEKRGKEFVAKANPPGQKTHRFFINTVNRFTLRRSMGLDIFNETLTRCTLDDPRNAAVLRLFRKWVVEDRLIPSDADTAAFVSTADAGAFGARLYQFKIGNIAMIGGGNYLTPALRHLGQIPLAVTLPPYREFPNAILGAEMLSIYAGSKHWREAAEYLEFLQSDAYLKTILENGDGIPTIPEQAHREAYLHPEDHLNEWGCNQEIVRDVEEVGYTYTTSPFVQFEVYKRIDDDAVDRYMTGLITAEEAGVRAAAEINEEIQLTLRQHSELREHYDQLCQTQALIDGLRKNGKKVPLSLILNPFLRAYYQFKGWAE